MWLSKTYMVLKCENKAARLPCHQIGNLLAGSTLMSIQQLLALICPPSLGHLVVLWWLVCPLFHDDITLHLLVSGVGHQEPAHLGFPACLVLWLAWIGSLGAIVLESLLESSWHSCANSLGVGWCLIWWGNDGWDGWLSSGDGGGTSGWDCPHGVAVSSHTLDCSGWLFWLFSLLARLAPLVLPHLHLLFLFLAVGW